MEQNAENDKKNITALRDSNAEAKSNQGKLLAEVGSLQEAIKTRKRTQLDEQAASAAEIGGLKLRLNQLGQQEELRNDGNHSGASPTTRPGIEDCVQLRAQLAKEVEKASKQRENAELKEKFAFY